MAASARARVVETIADLELLPVEERIRQRAYELYVQRGNQSGSEMEDWLQAEQEVLDSQDQRRHAE